MLCVLPAMCCLLLVEPVFTLHGTVGWGWLVIDCCLLLLGRCFRVDYSSEEATNKQQGAFSTSPCLGRTYASHCPSRLASTKVFVRPIDLNIYKGDSGNTGESCLMAATKTTSTYKGGGFWGSSTLCGKLHVSNWPRNFPYEIQGHLQNVPHTSSRYCGLWWGFVREEFERPYTIGGRGDRPVDPPPSPPPPLLMCN